MPSTSGEVLPDGQKLNGPSPKISVVFQEYTRSLMPWMTAEKNVALALTNQKLPKADVKRMSREALASVGLSGDEVSLAAFRRDAAARGDRPRPDHRTGGTGHG